MTRAFASTSFLVGRNSGLSASPERDRLGGDHVHQRPALQAGEDRAVDRLRVLLPARIMPPRGPRSVLWVVVVTKSAMPHRARIEAGGDQTGEVRDVGHQERAAPSAIARKRFQSIVSE